MPRILMPHAIDLVHVTSPDDYYCVPDHILDAAHEALIAVAIDDYVEHSDADAQGVHEACPADVVASLRAAHPRPTDLEEAKVLLSNLGRMTFARI